MQRKAILGAISGAVVAAGMLGAIPAFADSDLPDVRPHRHFIVTPNGNIAEVGPRVCDNPNLQNAFNQFHTNVHIGADGLHNHEGAEIRSGRC